MEQNTAQRIPGTGQSRDVFVQTTRTPLLVQRPSETLLYVYMAHYRGTDLNTFATGQSFTTSEQNV